MGETMACPSLVQPYISPCGSERLRRVGIRNACLQLRKRKTSVPRFQKS